jgi:hypothetical protein
VHEAAVLEPHAGVDQDVANRVILAPEPRGAVADVLAGGQSAQDVGDHVGVDVELGDVVADVLLGGVPQEVELSLVGAENGTVRPEEVQGQRSVLEEVLEIAERSRRHTVLHPRSTQVDT